SRNSHEESFNGRFPEDDEPEYGQGFGQNFGSKGFNGQRRKSPNQRKARPSPRAQTVSLPERAVRLLLQDPKQAALTSAEEMEQLGLPTDSLLIDLLRLLGASPGISTPALMGAWHGTEQGDELSSLAASEFLTPSTGVDQEFQDVLLALRVAAKEQQLRAATELETIGRLRQELEALKRSRRPLENQ
ncbi:MAG: hypothetical protein ACREDP_15695, partial [Bradyrhizobium sp.]